ncbi:unnamed protein product [Merluccius merluccius]
MTRRALSSRADARSQLSGSEPRAAGGRRQEEDYQEQEEEQSTLTSPPGRAEMRWTGFDRDRGREAGGDVESRRSADLPKIYAY